MITRYPSSALSALSVGLRRRTTKRNLAVASTTRRRTLSSIVRVPSKQIQQHHQQFINCRHYCRYRIVPLLVAPSAPTRRRGYMSSTDMTSNAAMQHLQKLTDGIMGKKITEPTLAFWRLENPRIMQALEAFCSGSDWNTTSDKATALKEVLDLFLELNDIMDEQERIVWSMEGSRDDVNRNGVSIVFGGKYSLPPKSISEKLVTHLVDDSGGGNHHIYTVSRTEQPSNTNVTHLTKQNLDSNEAEVGILEFQNVLEKGIEKWISNGGDGEFVVYFTLGQHKGVNPFVRNIQGAHNFATALTNTLSKERDSAIPAISSWKIVVTGTDATLPSTTSHALNRKLSIQQDDGTSIDVKIPSYHIMEYNYTYAMSKICQFYIIARAVAKIVLSSATLTATCDNCNDPPQKVARKEGVNSSFINELSQTITKLESYVKTAGEDGNYPKDGIIAENVEAVTMKELDAISKKFATDVEPIIAGNFKIAKDISICYTPLHALPWTEQAFRQQSDVSPKGFLIEQAVKRFKNAISINLASKSHF